MVVNKCLPKKCNIVKNKATVLWCMKLSSKKDRNMYLEDTPVFMYYVYIIMTCTQRGKKSVMLLCLKKA